MTMIEDAILTGKVKAALLLDERISAAGINVNTVDGIVTLEGTVESAVQRRLAEDVAILHGAHEVRNELEVPAEQDKAPITAVPLSALGRVTTPPGAPPSERAELEERVRKALAQDTRVDEHALVVEVRDNTAILSGRQGDVDAHNAAVETALHIPGIVAVDDEIEIMPAV